MSVKAFEGNYPMVTFLSFGSFTFVPAKKIHLMHGNSCFIYSNLLK